MKAKKLLLIMVGVLILVAGSYQYLFGGPYRFVDRSLEDQSLQHLRSRIGDGNWSASPSDSAFEYLYWWPQIDQQDRSKLAITISHRSTDEAIVTVIDRDCRSDSTYVTCDRLTMRRERDAWIPVRHQTAWQGRGRFGWTTKPTL